MAEKETKMNTGRKVLIGVILLLLLLTAAAYGFGVYYFSEYFLPGSFVNGFNCSYMDQAGTEKLLEQRRKHMCWRYRPGETDRKALPRDEIGLKYTSDGSVGELLHSQNRFLWFFVIRTA